MTTPASPQGRRLAPVPNGGDREAAPRRVITRRLADRFDVDNLGHYRLTFEQDDVVRTELVNARVTIMTGYADDVGEPYPLAATEHHEQAASSVSHYDVKVSRPGQTPVVLKDVTEDAFAKGHWVKRAELAELPVLMASGQSTRQDIVNAIRSSSPHPVVPAYGRLGWHHRGGRWLYVHGGGAWGAEGGVPDVRVHGDGLSTFTMSAPPATEAEGRRAFEALWNLFEMGPDRLAAVEIGAAFRASMGRPVGSLTYDAINMAGKSGRSAFISQCWAPGVTHKQLPFSASKEYGTPAYIEWVHHTFGDMIVVWDDMAPVGSTTERALYFDRFARSLFGGSSKGRMGWERQTQTLKARPRMRPRAFGVLSTEDLVAVESGQNRTHLVKLTREEFDPALFKAADQNGGPANRSALMSAFVIWWAGRMPAYKYVAEQEERFNGLMRQATGYPDRLVESVADKAAGLAAGLEFALSRGWVDQARADELWERGWAGLVESLHLQVAALKGNAMHERIIQALLDGLASHEVHVLDTKGSRPLMQAGEREQEAMLLGWDSEGRAQGKCIGWTDGQRLYLIPSAAAAFVTSYTSRTGAPIDLTHRAMGEVLRVSEVIPGSTQYNKKTGRREQLNTIAKSILGGTMRVWSLPWAPPNPDDVDQAGAEPDAGQPELPGLPPTGPSAHPAPIGVPVDPATPAVSVTGAERPQDAGPGVGVASGPLNTPAPCVACGELASFAFGGVALHVGCEMPIAAVPTPPTAEVAPGAPSPAVAGQAEHPGSTTPPTGPAGPRLVSAPTEGDPVPVAPAPGTSTADVEPASLAPSGQPEQAASAPGADWQPHRQRRWPEAVPVRMLALGADSEHLYGAGGQVLELGEALQSMPAFLARVSELMPQGGTVAITAQIAAQLGYPSKPVSLLEGKKLAEARSCRAVVEAAAQDWKSSKKGLSSWSTWYGEGHPDVLVVVLEWLATDENTDEDRQLITSADHPASAVTKLHDFRAKLGVSFVMSPGTSCTNLIKELRRAKTKAKQPDWWWRGTELPAGIEETHLSWYRELTDQEATRPYVIGLDRRKAYLAAMTGALMALGPLVHTGVDAGFDRSRAGYHLIAGEWQPYPMLPELTGGGGRQVWVPTRKAELLLKTGMPSEMILDAWLAPGTGAHSLPLAKEAAERIRDVLAAKPDEVDQDEERFYAIVKRMYAEGYGMLRTDRTRISRRDWADAIVATCTVTLLENVMEAAGVLSPAKARTDRPAPSGIWPVAIDTDCAFYAVSTDDPQLANPGLPLGQGLGRYDVKEIFDMAEWQTKLSKKNSRRQRQGGQ